VEKKLDDDTDDDILRHEMMMDSVKGRIKTEVL